MSNNLEQMINEAISSKNVDRASTLILNYLRNNTSENIVMMPGKETFSNSKGKGFGLRFFYGNKSIRFNWKTEALASFVESVDLWDGTSYNPNTNITFDRNTSFAALLPFAADIIENDGKINKTDYILVPGKISESSGTRKKILNEASKSALNVFDNVLVKLESDFKGQKVKNTAFEKAFGWRGYELIKTIINVYPSLFTENPNGSGVIFTGDINVIRQNKDRLIDAVGGSVATVSRGGNNESYSTGSPEDKMDENIEKVAFEDKLKHLSDLTDMLIKGGFSALWVAGRGGVGKSFNVFKTLKDAGLADDGEGFFTLTGSASAIGIFTTFYKYSNQIMVFDDADGALESQDQRNLIKAATDTKPVRRLVWMKKSSFVVDPDVITDEDLEEGKVPAFFDFTGKVIFISNLPIDKLDPDGALRTRGPIIEINPTEQEVYEFVGKIATNIKLENGGYASQDVIVQVLDILKENRNGKMNIRKATRGLNMQSTGVANWAELVRLYA